VCVLIGGLVALAAGLPALAQTGGTWSTTTTGGVLARLRELNTAAVEIRQIAFTPAGGSVILHGANAASWIQAPTTVGEKLRELIDAGTQVRFVAFDPDRDWVILHGPNEASWSDIPPAAAARIRELYQAGNQMKQVAFTSSGGWIILHGSNGYASSGLQ
jgi:hypothetical protein